MQRIDLHSLRQSLPTEPLFPPRGLRHFQGAVPFRYPRQKQPFIRTCLTGSHGKTVRLPDPSNSAEATNLPSNFTYGPPSAPPGGSPRAGLSCPHEPTAPQPRSAHPRSPGPRRPRPRYLPIPLPALASRQRARPPAATHRPRGAPSRLRPGLPAELLRDTGTRRASLPPCAHQEQPGKFRRPLPSLTAPAGAAYLCAGAPGCPPDPPALPAARRGR